MAKSIGKSIGTVPLPRKGMPNPKLSESEFKARYKEQFIYPPFEGLADEIDSIATVAWRAYSESRKSPFTRKAGPEFADPDYQLSADWLAARKAILDAQIRYEDEADPPRILFTTGFTRNAVVHNGVLDHGVNFIAKPFSIQQLASKLRDVLDA